MIKKNNPNFFLIIFVSIITTLSIVFSLYVANEKQRISITSRAEEIFYTCDANGYNDPGCKNQVTSNYPWKCMNEEDKRDLEERVGKCFDNGEEYNPRYEMVTACYKQDKGDNWRCISDSNCTKNPGNYEGNSCQSNVECTPPTKCDLGKKRCTYSGEMTGCRWGTENKRCPDYWIPKGWGCSSSGINTISIPKIKINPQGKTDVNKFDIEFSDIKIKANTAPRQYCEWRVDVLIGSNPDNLKPAKDCTGMWNGGSYITCTSWLGNDKKGATTEDNSWTYTGGPIYAKANLYWVNFEKPGCEGKMAFSELANASSELIAPTPCPNPPIPLLDSPTEGTNYKKLSFVDLKVNSNSQKCGDNEIEFWSTFTFPINDKIFSSGWQKNTSWHTGPYNKTGVSTWKVKSRYYDSYFKIYRESPYSSPKTYTIIP